MDPRSLATPPSRISPTSAALLLRQLLPPQRWPIALNKLPIGCALVGGAVRDGLLNRLAPHPDLDLVVPVGAIPLARQLAHAHGGVVVVLDAERDMARVVLGPYTLDLAACSGANLEEDLARRDYRINAMALPLDGNGPLLDPQGGLADLAKGLITAISEQNLQADPLRLLRGPRLAAELNFQLESASCKLLQRHGALLGQVAPERVLAELEKLARCSHGSKGLEQAIELGLLQPWLEPLQFCRNQKLINPKNINFDAACPLSSEEAATALPLARLAQLFSARSLGRLKASKKLQQRCQILRHWWQTILQNPVLLEEEQLRLCLDLEADLGALVLLVPGATEGWLERWRNPTDRLFHPRSPIDGAQLQQQLGLSPGPAIGALLWQLTKARAFGKPHNLEAAKHFLDQLPRPHD